MVENSKSEEETSKMTHAEHKDDLLASDRLKRVAGVQGVDEQQRAV